LFKNVVPEKIKLYGVVIVMVFFDLILLTVWSIKDPLQKNTLKLASEFGNNEEIIYEPEIEICKCNHETIWIGKLQTILISFRNVIK
jgi:hypothetical protein